jgi:uncharacterized protein YyaL (SSP411 family)
MKHTSNRLSDETSPYLLQHADNPVDWHPWGEEALALAREQDKPVLLSIGYSACHWCHVMAHESFENPDTARVMNERFVNIKVDREERPDLDKIYQVAHQMLVQRPGGWPLTMFLTPGDLTPFFGGTYFPPSPRHGLPAFVEILERVATFYHENRDEVERQGDAVRQVFERIGEVDRQDETRLEAALLERARTALEGDFESRYGGFGHAPKFPHSTSLERLLRLLRHWRSTARDDEPDLQALYMVTFTLQRMALGGIYDQLGGGFCRYSVDEYWMIPHFEKMLYDNGPLLALYSQAWAVTDDPLFGRVAAETAAWVTREMQSADGGYYSTLDADSEGHEGLFYVWDRNQVRRVLDDEAYEPFAEVYGLDRRPNFEGRWHLHTFRAPREVAEEKGIDAESFEEALASARQRLFKERERRVRPGRDDKILTAWNGLMIRGMAIAARHLQDEGAAASAAAAALFLRKHLVVEGRLLASWKDGRARFPAYLDDHAFLLDGLLELMQIEWRPEWLEFATMLADTLLERFLDRDVGGVFFTADDHETLLHRPRPLADEATPAGNGVAAMALARLGYLLGEARYLEAAEGTLKMAAGPLGQMPHAHCSLLHALEEKLDAPEIIIIRGKDPDMAEWHRVALLLYSPRRLVFAIPSDASGLPETLATKKPSEGTVGYLCRGTSCSPPLTTLSEFSAALRSEIG